jgi:hypothetical protein
MDDGKAVQLICIPNDEYCLPTRLYDGPFASLSDFWHLGGDYSNRLALIRLLSVTRVPTLIIVRNVDGTVVTDQGMNVIEAFDPEQYEVILKAWRNGRSGLGYFIGNVSFCSIM